MACTGRGRRKSSRECGLGTNGGLDSRYALIFLGVDIVDSKTSLGWSGGILSEENDFYDLVEAVSVSLFHQSLISHIFAAH